MANLRTAATSAAAIGIFMTGSAAFADVSAQQVWDDWKAYMAGFGYQLDSSESRSGDTLTVSDLVLSMELPEDEGTMKLVMDQFTFTDNGDGTVSLSIPPQMPMTLNIRPATGEAVDAVIDYNTTGYSVVVSGDPEDMTYNFSVADATISLAQLVVDGTPVDIGTASLSMKDITGLSNMKTGDVRETTQRFNAGPVAINIDFTDPESGGRAQVKGAYDSVSFDGGGTIPENMDVENMSAMMAAGFAFDGAFTSGGSSWDFDIQEEDETVNGSSTSGGGTLMVAMDGEKLSYSGETRDLTLNMSGGELPLPIELAMANSGFNLLMPIAQSDEEQDFAFGITLGDFTMSDLLWSLFDGAQVLPRDPATIALDLSGRAKVLVDIMDSDAMASVDAGESQPAELNALNLNSLTVRVAGAELTGDGAFTFDNSDLTTFDGVPAPDGAIDLQLVGGNGLLDKLITMGLVPEDQAMGMRMMMGLFAVPGEGEDTLNSKIEVSGDGQIKANGQRIK